MQATKALLEAHKQSLIKVVQETELPAPVKSALIRAISAAQTPSEYTRAHLATSAAVWKEIGRLSV